MDGELFVPRSSAARRRRPHPTAVQSRLDQHLSVDDTEVNEQLRADYTCPFCIEDFDIAALCCHMEELHCYDSNPVACPVCAARVGKDLVDHISLQHGQLLKKSSIASKESREPSLQSLFGDICFRSSSSGSSIAESDPLLSSFICNYSVPEADVTSKGTANTTEAVIEKNSSSDNEQPRFEYFFIAEQLEQRFKEEMLRANFLQHLILSTIFNES